jgi:hypothetical protein
MEPHDSDKIIRDRLDAGVLRRAEPVKVWIGYGSDRPCDGCGRRIRPAELEYHADYGPAETLRFHVFCYEFWDDARRRPGRQAD